MTPESASDNRLRASEEAAWWLLTLQSGELTDQERADFGDWLRRSPLNVAEMLRTCQLQRDLAGFDGWRQVAALDAGAAAASNVLELRLPDPAATPAVPRQVVPSQPEAAPRRRRLARFAAAAALMAAVAVGALLLKPRSQVYSTEMGEQRSLTLADGSVVALAPGSRLAVELRDDQRLLELRQGAALFRVAHDAARPFIVRTESARVRAVGTVFRVARDDQGVLVTVVEGRIAVSTQPPEGGRGVGRPVEPAELSLVANQQVAVSPRGVAEPVRSVAGNSDVVWSAEQLRFENQTVADVVRRFNQNNQVQIEVRDPRLAGRRISGVLRLSDPESFVAFIQAATDTRVSLRDPNHFVLRAAEPATGQGR